MGQVTSSVEGNLAAELLDLADIVLLNSLGKFLRKVVVVVNISLVVLLVVHLKDFADENWLKGIISELELWKSHWFVFDLHFVITITLGLDFSGPT